MSSDDFEPVTPGEILKDEFLKGYALYSEPARTSDRHFAQIVSPKSSTTGAASPPIPR